jgi:hypothetical protein
LEILAALLALAGAAQAAEDPCRERRYTDDLSALFVPARELGPDWETVRETPSNPSDDPEFRAAAVQATHSLHYTRERPGGSEVCSLEIWGFATAAAARRMQAEFKQPEWHIVLRGNLLMMTRGVTFEVESGFRPGLLPECLRLADLAEARARERLGCSTSGQ